MKKVKPYSDENNTTTSVNGDWKPLKPIAEGFEFVGDEQYDFLGFGKKSKSEKAKAKETRKEIKDDSKARKQDRRQDRKDIKKEAISKGSSRRMARQIAKSQIPKGKPARREAYLTLVKLNFRGFAYKLDAIINGSNSSLINQLKSKWQKYGQWQDLVDGVNIGKTRKPFVCGGKCRAKVLEATKSVTGVEEGVSIGAVLATAWGVIKSLLPILNQAMIGKQQRDAIDNSEREGQEDFDKLPPEQRQEIIDAEKALDEEAKRQSNEKYIWIGVGVVALAGIVYLLTKKKR
jgi:hypothetical protein